MRAALVTSLLVLAAACSSPGFNGVELDPPEPAPALTLADSSGARFDLAAQKGKVVLVFFGYTHCPDVCPTTLVEWRHAADSLGTESAKVRFVFVSVDPERDTPALSQRYAARFSPAFLGLTGTRADIDATLKAWKLAAFRDGIPGDTSATYTVSHPSQVFVVDRDGQLRLMHRAGLTPHEIASDIRALL
ncbi:MAG: SCO family protein [Gemmatimonadaceae bacterium]|nr:SCO family protein [Gemmatimonadaceae bacterium]